MTVDFAAKFSLLTWLSILKHNGNFIIYLNKSVSQNRTIIFFSEKYQVPKIFTPFMHETNVVYKIFATEKNIKENIYT